MFKKKIKTKKQSKEEQSEVLLYKIKIEDMPTSVIQFAYEEFMKIYNEEIDVEIKSDLQMKLVLLSKILTDRSLGYGNGEVKHFFVKRGEITEEQWSKLSLEQKNNASKLMQSIIKMEKEVSKLSNIDLDNTDHNIEVKVEDNLMPSILQNEKPKEKKKSLGGFFKKKVTKPVQTEKTEPKTEKKESVKELLKSVIKEQTKEMKIKERAKVLEEATMSKFKFPSPKFRDNENTDEKINFKTFENIYCHQCKHSLKAHQSKGVSGGCRCGCLETIEDIAKEHGLHLRDPIEVLQTVAEENPTQIFPQIAQEVKETPQIEASQIPTMPLFEEPIPIKQTIVKQAKAVETMFKNVKPNIKPNPDHFESSTQKILEQMQPETILPDKYPKKVVGDVCANCDHLPNLHFENPENSFCTVIGCTCEIFRSYPT